MPNVKGRQAGLAGLFSFISSGGDYSAASVKVRIRLLLCRTVASEPADSPPCESSAVRQRLYLDSSLIRSDVPLGKKRGINAQAFPASATASAGTDRFRPNGRSLRCPASKRGEVNELARDESFRLHLAWKRPTAAASTTRVQRQPARASVGATPGRVRRQRLSCSDTSSDARPPPWTGRELLLHAARSRQKLRLRLL